MPLAQVALPLQVAVHLQTPHLQVPLPPQVAADTPAVGGFTAAGGFSPANTRAAGGSITAGGCRPPAYAAKILQLNTAQSTWQGQLIATANTHISS